MANKLDPMDLKQILNLHSDGFSNRKIATTLGVHRNTINTYIRLFKSCEYSIQELQQMETAALNKLFPAHTTIVNPRYNELMLYFEKMNQEPKHPGFTFLYHYHEYSQQAKEPYGYTQFMEHYRRKYAKEKGSMKLEHEPGYELFVDFAGKKLPIVNRDTGEVTEVEVFVAILPSSQYTYIEACMSQKREDLLGCMANALSFFGGVPKAIVSDNLKTAVTRACKYEPDINRSLKDFARHYNCVINPTRGYSPQDKALVENAVNLAYQRVYYPSRKMTFFSLDDLNREIKTQLSPYNDLFFQRKDASRKELFQSIERSRLKPLPDAPYELKNYRRAKVQKMGYVYFSPDKSYYSVPYRYIGKSTLIHYTKTTVEVYYNNERIASHKRDYSPGIYNTIKDHLSSTHQNYVGWSPDYFKSLASKHGSNVVACVEGLLAESDYLETAYKRSMGLIQLHRYYGSERLNNACAMALYAGTHSYNRIKSILKNKMDIGFTEHQPEEEATQSHIPFHENIRGANNYL